MKTYHIETLINLTEEEVWALPEGPLKIEFHDETIESHSTRVQFSWYPWELFRQFPGFEILHTHMHNEPTVGKSSSDKVLNAIRWHMYDNGFTDNELVSLHTYRAQNMLYNAIVTRCDRYVSTIIITDFIDIIDHPEIKKANAELKPTEYSIKETYRKIIKITNESEELTGNNVVDPVRANMLKTNQYVQCVSARGFMTDIDSNIFVEPVLQGYVEGVNTIYGNMVESRSASKSLMYTKKPLQDSELANRTLQLAAHPISNLHGTDCGSTEGITITVKSSDLKTLSGAFQILDDGNLRAVRPEHTHLIGKTIKLRNPIYCKSGDRHGTCTTCLGEISAQIPGRTNLGHVSTTELAKRMSQEIMSFKHVDESSSSKDIELTDHEASYLKTMEGEAAYYLADRLEGKKVTVCFSASEAEGVTDFMHMKKDQAMNLTMFSSISEVIIQVQGEEDVTLSVGRGSRRASLSQEFLYFLISKDIHINDFGYYVVNMDGWGFADNIAILPKRNIDVTQNMMMIKNKILGSKVRVKGDDVVTCLRASETPEAALHDLYSLVNATQYVNIAHLSIIVRTMLYESDDPLDHRLPTDPSTAKIGRFKRLFSARSAGGALAYQNHKGLLFSTATYLNDNREDHLLDPLILP